MGSELGVTVLIPLYGESPYLEYAINSALQQDYPNGWEIVVVYRNSVDTVKKLQKKFSENCVLWIEQRSVGIVGALNEGIKISKFELIARLDADDLMVPGRIKNQVSEFIKRKNLIVLGGQADIINENGDLIGKIRYPTGEKFLSWSLNMGSYIAHPGSMIRKNAILEIGGYRNGFEHAEDYNLWLRLRDIGLVDNLRNTVLQYRRHSLQLSEVNSEEIISVSAAMMAVVNETTRSIGSFDSSQEIENFVPKLVTIYTKTLIALQHGEFKILLKILLRHPQAIKFIARKIFLHSYFVFSR